MKDKWYKSRRMWSAIIVAASGVSMILVQADVYSAGLHVQIGQIVGALGGSLGVGVSWMKPKAVQKKKRRK